MVSIFHLSSDAPPLTPNQVVTIVNPVVNNEAFHINAPSGDTTLSSAAQTPPPALLIQVHQIENIKVDGRQINSKIMAAPQLKVDLFSS